MSGSTNNFTPSSRNWQTESEYVAYVPSSSGWNHTRSMFPRFGPVSSFHADLNANRGAHHPQQSFEETMILEPPGFPELYSPPLIRVTDNGMARELYQRERPIILDSPPRLMNRQNIIQAPSQDSRLDSPPSFMNPSQDSRLSPDEQKRALKKLKREIYNPTPKKLMRGLSLYYRDNARNISSTSTEKQEEKDNYSKSCAVCLEDFEAKERVMVTPCNHMFHEECIVPWIKSNGHCPVCRFALCEGMRTNASSANNFVNAQANNELLARELMAVIRAVEEAFIWDYTTH